MPSGARLARARLLGLCIDCTHLPSIEGRTRCPRCAETHRLRDARRKEKRNLKRRLRKANAHIYAAYAKQVVAALENGDSPPPLPELITYTEGKWYYVDRLRGWKRKKPKKRYKYLPRPLPKPQQSVVECSTSSNSAVVERIPSGPSSV